MTGRDSLDPELLLAAYATGALEGEEAEAVERHLADNPAAAEDLDQLRGLIATIRRAEPQPRDEPDWNKLAQSISAACTSGERRFPWVRWGYAAGLVTVAAFGLFLWLRPPAPPVAIETTPDDSSPQAELPELDLSSLRVATIEDLEGEELDDLLLLLDHNPSLPLDEAITEDQLPVPGATADDEAITYATGFGLDLFAEPDYDQWIEDLDESEIDALEELLAEAQAG